MEKHYTQEALDHQVPPSSEVLNLVAERIPIESISSPEVQSLIGMLFRVAHGRQGDDYFPTLVGLAAPQIGVSQRVVVIGMEGVSSGEQPELKEFINPTIIEVSGRMVEGREGCFSTGRICGIVERPESVTVHAWDKEGEDFIHSFEGFTARVAQHEIDHLDGIRFPDKITNPNKLHWVEENQYGDYRKHWQNWSKHVSEELWKRMKTGLAESDEQ